MKLFTVPMTCFAANCYVLVTEKNNGILIDPGAQGDVYKRQVGDKETIEKLLATEIVMEIDLSESEVQPGQYQRSVRIYAPTKGFVWAVGDYSAVISVKEK